MSVITQDGSSALMLAAQVGITEVVSLLLEAGADIGLQDEVRTYYKQLTQIPHQVSLLMMSGMLKSDMKITIILYVISVCEKEGEQEDTYTETGSH